MEQSNSFKLKKILNYSENQYILVCSINDFEQQIIIDIATESPIFGVNFPDNFMLAMRDFPPPTIPNIVGRIRKHHASVKTKQKFSSELQAA